MTGVDTQQLVMFVGDVREPKIAELFRSMVLTKAGWEPAWVDAYIEATVAIEAVQRDVLGKANAHPIVALSIAVRLLIAGVLATAPPHLWKSAVDLLSSGIEEFLVGQAQETGRAPVVH